MPVQRPVVNHTQYLIVGCNGGLRQILQAIHHDLTLPQKTECEFANDERMREHLSMVQQSLEEGIALAQVVNPDRGVNQNHLVADFLRGIGLNLGSVPPSRASLRALSRSIRAFSASRTRAVFSLRPVHACALTRSSSSIASVARIWTFLQKGVERHLE